MTRYIAFLRAINVGGHVVKMDALRGLFESLGFSNVETFIASGNVLFETNLNGNLEKKIESKLREALGYDVATFIRTDAELKAIANYKAFAQSQLDAATAFNWSSDKSLKRLTYSGTSASAIRILRTSKRMCCDDPWGYGS